jgi:glycerol kinase
MPLILAIDQSTSATKAILFDATGRVMDQEARDHQQHYPQPGWVEHDAEEIWQNVLTVIREIAKRHRDGLSRLAALSLTNQRETVLVFDRRTGQPLCPALVWQDRRGDALCADLVGQGYADLIRSRTGLRIDTYFSASKIRWLMEHHPELAAKLRNGDALIGTIDTYLIHRLTRGEVFATDFTNASRTLLFDISRLQWDEELCALFAVPMSALPAPRESADRFGITDAEGILPNAVPIVGVMGDSQASLFAQGCFESGMAKATFGTGTSILLNIGSTPRIAERGAVTALAWVWQGQPTYAFEGLINFSAATIEWLKNQLGLIQSADEVEALAVSVEDNGGVFLVPAFAGLSAPYWSPQARAAIVGMTAHTRKEHIVRAALESIAFQVQDVLGMMHGDAGVRPQRLHVDGGPTRNHFLMQFTADVTRAELRASRAVEASAWGATMNGLLGLGQFPSPAALPTVARDSRQFLPRMEAGHAQKLCRDWQTAVQRVL